MFEEFMTAVFWYAAVVGGPLLIFFWLGVHFVAEGIAARRNERDRVVEEANAAGVEPPPKRSAEIRKIVISLPVTVTRARRAERSLGRDNAEPPLRRAA